ncbi:Uncharacterised protein [Vibrio cholerae]|nr:Uncharacterised protein [Vibrio cholerae]
MWNTKFFHDELSLCAFTCTRSTEKNDAHVLSSY